MEYIGSLIAKFIFNLSGLTSAFWQNLKYTDIGAWQIVLDILIVTVIFYYLLKMLKGSRASNVVLGLVIIGIVYLISTYLKLLTVSWLLEHFFTIILVAIPILFQQELRMALEKIGNTHFFIQDKHLAIDSLITAIIESCDFLVKSKEGALIVIQHGISLKEYIDNGIKLDSLINKEVLISIFHGKGPLHDGAVIIANGRIASAGSVLPTSFDNKDKNLGTRHKAAIGLTDHTDASVIVVSEERGAVSFAKNGKLEKNIDFSRLQQLLKIVLTPNDIKKKAKKLLRS